VTEFKVTFNNILSDSLTDFSATANLHFPRARTDISRQPRSLKSVLLSNRPSSATTLHDQHATGIERLILESDNRVSSGVDRSYETHPVRLISKAIRERGWRWTPLSVGPSRVQSLLTLFFYARYPCFELSILIRYSSIWLLLSRTLPRSSDTNVMPDR